MVREDILLGRLRPGTTISQNDLAQQLGTSRIPVRDAIQQLSHEGFLTPAPRGQCVVTRLTAEDILDTFAVLALAVGRAARRATALASDDDIVALTALQEHLEEAARTGDAAAIVELNWDFHRRVNVIAASPRLLSLIRSVRVVIPQAYLLEFPAPADEVAAAKKAILRAIATGKAKQAESLMRAHVDELGAHLVEYFRRRGLVEGDSATPGPRARPKPVVP
jgi:DNA-binding GntR family transcriptional regulator